jgi:hypothetical protein
MFGKNGVIITEYGNFGNTILAIYINLLHFSHFCV